MGIFGNRRQPETPEQPTRPTPAPAPERMPQPQSPQPVPIPPQPIGFETVLGANSTLEGSFTSSSNVRIDGTFTGKLEINGNVLIGETAKISADVQAKNISIAGAVRGNVTGKKVQLLRTGRVWGDITATALTTEEGAFIDGKISMLSHEAAQFMTAAASTTQPLPLNISELPESSLADVENSEPDFLQTADTDDAVVERLSTDS